ncbi:unnamed protein product [Linum tenue]|uniref:Transmembrane protein n=1 Tax=Linum tenue TaxID=586396 RepID=A0AAV0R6R2_9ROSI|nr:unnamed protein product [Linum tenue]
MVTSAVVDLRRHPRHRCLPFCSFSSISKRKREEYGRLSERSGRLTKSHRLWTLVCDQGLFRFYLPPFFVSLYQFLWTFFVYCRGRKGMNLLDLLRLLQRKKGNESARLPSFIAEEEWE